GVADGGAESAFKRLRIKAAVFVGQCLGIGRETLGFLKSSPKSHLLLFLSIPLRWAPVSCRRRAVLVRSIGAGSQASSVALAICDLRVVICDFLNHQSLIANHQSLQVTCYTTLQSAARSPARSCLRAWVTPARGLYSCRDPLPASSQPAGGWKIPSRLQPP